MLCPGVELGGTVGADTSTIQTLRAQLLQEMIDQQADASPEGATGCDHDRNSQNRPAVEWMSQDVIVKIRVTFSPNSENLF